MQQSMQQPSSQQQYSDPRFYPRVPLPIIPRVTLPQLASQYQHQQSQQLQHSALSSYPMPNSLSSSLHQVPVHPNVDPTLMQASYGVPGYGRGTSESFMPGSFDMRSSSSNLSSATASPSPQPERQPYGRGPPDDMMGMNRSNSNSNSSAGEPPIKKELVAAPSAAAAAPEKDPDSKKQACVVCHHAKTSCDGQRPCSRCVRLGREDQCHERPHKEHYKTRQKRERDEAAAAKLLAAGGKPSPTSTPAAKRRHTLNDKRGKNSPEQTVKKFPSVGSDYSPLAPVPLVTTPSLGTNGLGSVGLMMSPMETQAPPLSLPLSVPNTPLAAPLPPSPNTLPPPFIPSSGASVTERFELTSVGERSAVGLSSSPPAPAVPRSAEERYRPFPADELMGRFTLPGSQAFLGAAGLSPRRDRSPSVPRSPFVPSQLFTPMQNQADFGSGVSQASNGETRAQMYLQFQSTSADPQWQDATAADARWQVPSPSPLGRGLSGEFSLPGGLPGLSGGGSVAGGSVKEEVVELCTDTAARQRGIQAARARADGLGELGTGSLLYELHATTGQRVYRTGSEVSLSISRSLTPHIPTPTNSLAAIAPASYSGPTKIMYTSQVHRQCCDPAEMSVQFLKLFREQGIASELRIRLQTHRVSPKIVQLHLAHLSEFLSEADFGSIIRELPIPIFCSTKASYAFQRQNQLMLMPGGGGGGATSPTQLLASSSANSSTSGNSPVPLNTSTPPSPASGASLEWINSLFSAPTPGALSPLPLHFNFNCSPRLSVNDDSWNGVTVATMQVRCANRIPEAYRQAVTAIARRIRLSTPDGVDLTQEEIAAMDAFGDAIPDAAREQLRALKRRMKKKAERKERRRIRQKRAMKQKAKLKSELKALKEREAKRARTDGSGAADGSVHGGVSIASDPSSNLSSSSSDSESSSSSSSSSSDDEAMGVLTGGSAASLPSAGSSLGAPSISDGESLTHFPPFGVSPGMPLKASSADSISADTYPIMQLHEAGCPFAKQLHVLPSSLAPDSNSSHSSRKHKKRHTDAKREATSGSIPATPDGFTSSASSATASGHAAASSSGSSPSPSLCPCTCPRVLERPMMVLANREWERLFGYSQAELRTMVIRDGPKRLFAKSVGPDTADPQ
jgi:hypothetical protein